MTVGLEAVRPLRMWAAFLMAWIIGAAALTATCVQQDSFHPSTAPAKERPPSP